MTDALNQFLFARQSENHLYRHLSAPSIVAKSMVRRNDQLCILLSGRVPAPRARRCIYPLFHISNQRGTFSV
jgi:hypothetical protein